MRAAGPSQGVKVPLRGSDPRAAEERGGNMNGARSPLLRRAVGVIGFACGVALTGCASGPAVPDWRLNAQTASERATQADLQGKTRIATSEFDRMRREIARTGDAALMARAELLRCSIQVASLAFGPCARFEALRADATVAELAYADYLAGRVSTQAVPLLPAAQQAAARRLLEGGAVDARDVDILAAIADPLARLVAAAVWLQAGQGHPAVMALAVETASAQGWSRPLLAWLHLQARHAELAGDEEAVRRLRRRIDLVLGVQP